MLASDFQECLVVAQGQSRVEPDTSQGGKQEAFSVILIWLDGIMKA